jgi:aminoglycoside phosphotransferase family enzyme
MNAPSLSSAKRLEKELAFLRSPSNYSDNSERIEVVETHFAWVFLSRTFAYKLYKPVRFHDIDYTTIEKRKKSCELALQLNRRLAPHTYIDCIALTDNGSGLTLAGAGKPIDWLLKMRRLPDETMFDTRLADDRVSKSDLATLARYLVEFYKQAPVAPWSGTQYRQALRRSILRCGEWLSALPIEFDISVSDRLVAAQVGFIERNSALLEERVDQGHVVDCHGDLRPEHISLDERCEIIDCIEFSDILRLLDSAEELSFLALECNRLQRPDIAKHLMTAYQLESDDFVNQKLLDFYSSRQALNRAMLSAWHLEAPFFADSASQWIERTNWYLAVGQSHIEEALK